MIHPRTLSSLEYGEIIQVLAAHCLSDAGRGLALALSPLPERRDAELALTLYQEAEIWRAQPVAGGQSFVMAAFPDISGVLAAAKKDRPGEGAAKKHSILTLEAFWGLAEALRLAQAAHRSIMRPESATLWPNLADMASKAPFPEQLAAALSRCISDDGLLKDESSPELYRLRQEMRSLHQNCLHKVKDFAQKYNILPYLQDEFMTLSSDRYVLPLKANFKGRLQGIIHDWSQTGETCYFEPIFLVDINNRLRELKHEEAEEERKILDYLAGLLQAALPEVETVYTFLANLDLLNAKSLLAQSLDANCPTFGMDNEGIELIGARHPLLALRRKKQNAPPVKPLDIVLRPGERVLVITGGNAGGKTVCLKTLGLLATMAMSGLPIPADKGSRLPWFERIDAFIGDEQSIADNVSTFTAQIDHLAKAWKHLDNHGLALLDEFGAGTDPAEGSALAQAVLDGLLEKRCFALSATHFPALKSYALTQKGVRAASMLFDPASNRPLFKLAYDQVGSSQALSVATEHGLPPEILARARHYLLQDGQDSGNLVTRLNALAVEREEEIASLKDQERKAANQLKDKQERLEKERLRLQKDISDKIRELTAAWKAGKAGARQTIKEMSGLRAELGLDGPAIQNTVLPAPDQIAKGDRVFYTVFNKRGTVTDVDERKKRVRLDLDGVGMWADIKDIALAPGNASRAEKRSGTVGATVKGASALAPMTLDVRGLRADEAIAEVGRFLDKALLAGYGEVEIVHGRGTGALRREIHSYLSGFPAVASLATAPEDRGGDGMTMVTLK